MRGGVGFLAYVRRHTERQRATDTLVTLGVGMFAGAAIMLGCLLVGGALR
jgi:hypothetical protein